jgi:DNA-binding transcriptional ArsR family regulator
MAKSQAKASGPTLGWDIGTAYEFFISLHVLHTPDYYGIRASWAAGIRSRIPAVERKFLEEVLPFLGFPIGWVYRLPKPKDAIGAMWALRQIPPVERIPTVFECAECDEPFVGTLLDIAKHRSWTKEDLEAILPEFAHKSKSEYSEASIKKYLDWWARPDEFGEMFLTALQAYHQAFFEDEEKRIAPVLQAGLERAQKLAKELSVPELIAELSQGVHIDDVTEKELIIAPAYWSTPLVAIEKISPDQKLLLFGARPATMAAIPGEFVPDSLVRALKALADPTRLKILRYLTQEEVTPSELARRLNLRAPTVTHHLSELRLSGLVNLRLKGQEKFYGSRLEALDATCDNLRKFLQDHGENDQ